MRTDYQKPWKLSFDLQVTKSELRMSPENCSVTWEELGKGENDTIGILLRICETLNCNIGDCVDALRRADDMQGGKSK